MPRCPNCSYVLVLIERRGKYKCAKCGKLFLQKQIEDREFREWNKRERQKDLEESKILKRRQWSKNYYYKNIEKRRKYGREYNRKRRQEKRKAYYIKNREKILAYKKEWRKKAKEKNNQTRRVYRKNNLDLVRVWSKIHYWR